MPAYRAEDFKIDQVWDTDLAWQHLQTQGQTDTKRTGERRLSEHFWPDELSSGQLQDEHGLPANHLLIDWALAQARSKRKLPLFAQLHSPTLEQLQLHANDARGARYWLNLPAADAAQLQQSDIIHALQRLQKHMGKNIAVFPSGALTGMLRTAPDLPDITLSPWAYAPVLGPTDPQPRRTSGTPAAAHLQRLEDESIQIIREAVAESDNPVMLYSVGKDSAVMLQLVRKAFYPAPPPLPLLHVDTRWKFQEMYLLRDRMAQQSGMTLHVHINPDAIAQNINPFDHGSALHTDITKTEGLKQALDQHRFDAIFGGARRDEEKSRAKERIFSFRSATHRWDPKNQRPELWNLYNTRKTKGESFRVFPLSNWTEIDIWQYIDQENIPVVPLYFAKRRPVVIRDGMILMVDDDRFRLLPGEKIHLRNIRFRTLGCYPLTGAIESNAQTVKDIIQELITSRTSERQGRVIDADASASMEKKKQEGYF